MSGIARLENSCTRNWSTAFYILETERVYTPVRNTKNYLN